MTIVVGGVGELYQGDLDAGRHLADRLAGSMPAHVLVEELHYGAIAVSQMLEDVRPDALVLAGAVARGQPPGSITRRRVADAEPAPDVAQRAVLHAATGYVDLDLILTVCATFGTLPARTVVVEIEPQSAGGPADTLSATMTAALDDAEQIIRLEVARLPLMVLVDRIREEVDDDHLAPAGALGTLHELLVGLDVLDETGRWNTVLRSRDRLRSSIRRGATGEGMGHLDWGLWWALIEEIDRLKRLDVGPNP